MCVAGCKKYDGEGDGKRPCDSGVNGCKDAPACACSGSRRYAGAKKFAQNLIGAQATITVRYGKMCCEKQGGTKSAYQVAYAGVTRFEEVPATPPTQDLKWAQCGWGRERLGAGQYKNFRYGEVRGNGYLQYRDPNGIPADGSTHVFSCTLDTATGTWTFFDNGTQFWVRQDDYWKSKTGERLDYTGEIGNQEDDMPGTAGAKCTFTGCQYQVDGVSGLRDAGLTAADVKTDDAAEWGADWVSATGLSIWDKKPL